MSHHHLALRRQAVLNALNALRDLDPAAPVAPVIDLGTDPQEFDLLCGEALLVLCGSGSAPVFPISSRTTVNSGR